VDWQSSHTLMIKCLPRTSPELFLLLELNQPDYRQDPWNPTPHILCAVERGNHVFLCIHQLVQFNSPPFKTIANYIDFISQALEVRGTYAQTPFFRVSILLTRNAL
jgi:hypothetical protein